MENSKKILWAQLKMTTLRNEQYDRLWEMGISYRNGFPRISISKIVDGLSHVALTLPITPAVLSFIAKSINKVASGVQEMIEFTCKNNVYENDTRTDTIRPNGRIKIAREGSRVYFVITFLHADVDSRVASLQIPTKENSVSFKFSIDNNSYFDIDDNLTYASAYADMLEGLNVGYLALYAERESREKQH